VSVIFLADDSIHAVRMGEKILCDEGFDVATACGGAAAISLLADVEPDVLIADVFLPECNGLELCRRAKAAHHHTRVILTAGMLEEIDEAKMRQAGCDAILRKPFEASAVIETVKRLAKEARQTRDPGAMPAGEIRAAVAKAVEEEMPRFIRELTEKVLAGLKEPN